MKRRIPVLLLALLLSVVVSPRQAPPVAVGACRPCELDPTGYSLDCNHDRTVDVSDAICLLTWLFVDSTRPPQLCLAQTQACEACDDRFVNEGQANAITTAMIEDGTVGGSDVNREAVIQVRALHATAKVGVGTSRPQALLEVAKDNQSPALLLKHPDSNDPAWDGGPIAALKISGPDTPTTRNFVSGLWVETLGGAVDKGRGVIVTNYGKSDGVYVQQDGAAGTGLAILLTQEAIGATGMVIGTTASSQPGLVVRQETALDPQAGSNALLQLEANGSVTEMVRLSSRITNQAGLVARMIGPGSKPIVIVDAAEEHVLSVSTYGRPLVAGQGKGRALADGWDTYSSRKLKEDIAPLEAPLDKVQRLRGVSFRWKGTKRRDLGLIAEEVEEVLPELVQHGEDAHGDASLDYGRLSAVLVEAIKSQQGQLEALRNELRALEARVAGRP
ncbi:MAG: tail fiber domain-containing protein [Planctomycetes bacterium]|nr:tail fiber domain-containing protein [Planctomycetota bacterium]